jgi:hypothetical protein
VGWKDRTGGKIEEKKKRYYNGMDGEKERERSLLNGTTILLVSLESANLILIPQILSAFAMEVHMNGGFRPTMSEYGEGSGWMQV